MSEGRGKYTFIGIKKFYTADEIMQRIKVNKKALMETALMAGAVYKYGNIVLINKAKLDSFCEKMNIYNLDVKSLYIGPMEASEKLGMPVELVNQLASRANALYRINGRFFVRIDRMNKYFQEFKVNVTDEFDEIFRALKLKVEDEDDV